MTFSSTAKPALLPGSVTLAVLVVLAASAAAVWPPVAAVIGLAALALAVDTWTETALSVGAITGYIVRPLLDPFHDTRLGGVNPAEAFGIAMLVWGGVIAFRRWIQGEPLWPDRLFGAGQSLLIALHLILVASGAVAFGAAGFATGGRDVIRMLSWLAAGMMLIWWLSDGTPGRIRQGWTLLVAGALAPIGVGVYQALTNSGNLEDEGLNRVYGTFTHPQSFGVFLVPLVMVGIAGVVRLHGRWRGASAAWVGLTLTLLALTYSRTFLITLLVAVGLFVALPAIRLRLRQTLEIAGGALVLLAGAWLWFGDLVRARFEGISISGSAIREAALAGASGNSFQWRVINWVGLIQKGLDHLWIGHGLAMTPVLNPLFDERVNTPFSAHDDFVRFFFEGGLLGLTLHGVQLAMFALWLIRVSRRTPAPWSVEANAVVATLLALYLFTAGTTEMSQQTASMYEVYLLIGLLCAMRVAGRSVNSGAPGQNRAAAPGAGPAAEDVASR